MTFTQLRTFALVAELGSLRAAASALGVSEPAVSASIAALRSDLGDPLFRRTASGIALTPGGRALAGRARELVRLAERTRREVASATSTARLRVLATAACAEYVAGDVVTAFTRRVPGTSVELVVGSSDCAASALAEDDADIALGVRPLPSPGRELDSVPFLRYQRVLVAGPGHPLAGRRSLRGTDLAGERWFTGPAGLETGSEEHRWAQASGAAAAADVTPMDSEADALTAVRSGDGLLLALEHAVCGDLRRGALVRLPAAGTPVTGMWWATVPGAGRAAPAARALQRFLTTPDATTALLARPERPARARPTVRVELWS
ncbi:MAG: LysR family transcriptional regulator [Blastococcus sp.]|nr:LysR family transcriptional regulator [Blastococcus sp.]